MTTLEEAADYLRCHPKTITRRAKVLHISHKRLGSLWRFYRPDLKAWMKEDQDKKISRLRAELARVTMERDIFTPRTGLLPWGGIRQR